MKEGYKKTEVGIIPNEWDAIEVGELVSTLKSGLSRSLKDEDIGVPCIRSNNIKNNRLILNDLKYWFRNDDKGARIEDYILKKGDIIINFINSVSQIGKGCIFDQDNFETIYTTNLLRIQVNEEKMNNKFFHYYAQTEKYKKEVALITKPAVNQASFTTVEYKAIKFPVPPLKEQQKISEILSTVDSQIDDTDKLIEKTKKLKKGLMQRLLTKGIGHTEFKMTEIGEIPVEWEVGNNFINIFSGVGFKLNEYVDNGIPLVRINNVTHGKILDEGWCYLPDSYKSLYKEYMLKKGDILLALNRPITRGELKICVVNMQSSILYQRVGKLVMDKERYYPKFFYYYMQSNLFMKKLEAGLVGTDQPYIKNSEFKEMKFAIPSLNEQKQIVSILSSVDTQIEEYENKKAKLEQLKKALMQQLLTGKIRA